MKILIPIDGSAFSKHMLDYVAAHPLLFSTEHQYTVLVVVLGVPSYAASMVSAADLAGYYQDEAEKVLGPARAFFQQQGYQVAFTSQVGHPAEVIAHTATAGNYDLLVMGSHGHSALGNLVMGSITTKVLAHCKTPVLIVR